MSYEIYSIISSHLTNGRHPLEVARAAIGGGAKVIQLREKVTSTLKQVQLAEALMNLCVKEGVKLIINDRLDIALAVDAHGLHLGQDDFPVNKARQLLKPGQLLGVSTHSLEQALLAQELAADYIGFGPVFPTTSKDDLEPLVGLQQLSQIVAAVDIPVVAIGGINYTNVAKVAQAGGENIAVISAISKADDMLSATRNLQQIFTKAKRQYKCQ